MITGIGIGLMVILEPLSLLVTEGFELIILILYPVPAGVPIGILQVIVPETNALTVPRLVGFVKLPFAFDN